MGIMDAFWPELAVPALTKMASAFPLRNGPWPMAVEPHSTAGLASVATLVSLFIEAPVAPTATDIVGALQHAWQTGYERAPALMIGLAVLAAVPPLALIGFVIGRLGRRDEDGTRTVLLRRKGAGRAAGGGGTTHGTKIRHRRGAIVWTGRDGVPRRLEITRELVRIGREPDNDIVLDERTVHRYHAAIHRPDGTHAVVTDLSGPSGNGVILNGKRVESHGLKPGDTIELGAAKLEFTE